jgi:hypothetical protein
METFEGLTPSPSPMGEGSRYRNRGRKETSEKYEFGGRKTCRTF